MKETHGGCCLFLQMRTLVRSFVRQSKANLQDLELPDLVALGHLLCGLQVAEIKQLNSYEFRYEKELSVKGGPPWLGYE